MQSLSLTTPTHPLVTHRSDNDVCVRCDVQHGSFQTGMRQMYATGQALKARYIDGQPYRLLPAAYNESLVSSEGGSSPGEGWVQPGGEGAPAWARGDSNLGEGWVQPGGGVGPAWGRGGSSLGKG